MTFPISKRADQLVVGDRILHKYLPSPWFPEPGEVVYVKVHDYRRGRYVFVAYMQDNGFYDSTSYQVDGYVQVIPADTGLGYSRPADGETTQPIAGRVPPHFGAVVNEGGHTAVEVAGGLIAIDPPEVARELHIPHCPARYDSSEPCVPGCRESAEQRGVAPASAD
jgi:hypothetical protein